MNYERVIIDIKKSIKEHLDNNYAYDTLVNFELDVIDWNSLFEYIKQLKEELEEYKNPIKYFKHANKNVVEENKQLKDNWNKLKEYCKENTLCYEVGDDENTKLIGSKIHGLNVLDKMQELEQGDDK